MKSIINKFINNIYIERRFFLTLLVLECFIKTTPQLSFGKYPIYIVCIVGLLILIKRLIFNIDVMLNKKHIWHYLFIVSLLISSMINNAMLNYGNWVVLCIYALMFFVVSNFDYKEDVKCIIDEIVFIARLVTFLHLIYNIASIIDSVAIHDFEIKGLLGYSYFYAYNCVTVIGFSLFLFLYEKNKVIKYIELFNLLLHLITVFFTRSRASYLGIFIALLVVLYIIKSSKLNAFDMQKTKKVLCVFVIIIAISIIMLSMCFKFSIASAISKVFSFNNMLSWRDIIWKVSFMAFLSGNVLFGTSIGLLPSFISNYINNVYRDTVVYGKYGENAYESAFGMASSGYLHNVFIQQLCAHGLFGLVVMIIYVYEALKRYVTIIKKGIEGNDTVLLMMICFAFTFVSQVIISQFDDNLFFNIVYICNVFFFYSIGIIDYLFERNSYVKNTK